MTKLRIGSRGSQLALWQAEHVKTLLAGSGQPADISIIKTSGDKILDVPLSLAGKAAGGKGLFTKEIEEALAAGSIDIAVHSLKDLPTELEDGFDIAAILPREDARDAFLSAHYNSVSELPPRARVGTSSLRRQAQLLSMRPDVQVDWLRGNVDTRLRKLEEGGYDAILLAAAGLIRLGLAHKIKQLLPIEVMCPAAGQGALAIEVRADDAATRKAISALDDLASRSTVTAERAMLNALGGGCQVPIGAHARFETKRLILLGIVASPDGTAIIAEEQEGFDPIALGHSVAETLLARGARKILDLIYTTGLKAAAPLQP